MNDPVGRQIGDYQILKVLGAGGMGRVYKVRNTITDRVEAMKVLLPDLEGREELVARFLREIKVLAGLNHPNIAALHTALTIENQLVMVMEYVEGEALSARLSRGAIDVADALTYMDQVLDALSYAHQHHVIHRDIKPANIMVTPQGAVKLMDFGIARSNRDETKKLTATGSTLGSLNYMSPEQINGQPTDERSDLYSLGISLYEMLTGERPFKGDSDFNIMVAHLTKEPTPPVQLHPGLPEVVNALVLKSIAKAPGDRFQSANEFRRAVQAAIETAEVHAGKAQVQVAPNTSLVGTLPSMKAHSAAAAQEERTLVQGSRDDTTSGIAAMAQAAAAAKSKTSVVVAPAVQSASVTSPQPSGSRGLYMALGALVVIVVLAAAGIYLPLRKKAAAAPEPVEHNIPTQQSSQSAPQVSPLGQPVVNEQKPAEALQPTGNPKSPVSRAKKLVAQNASSNAASSTPDEAAPPQPSQAEVDALEHEIDQLSARAAAVNNSLDNFQRSSGFGLRGDMVSKQASMKLNLAKAEDAVSRGDLERAKRYQGLAESDVEALEKFLGR